MSEETLIFVAKCLATIVAGLMVVAFIVVTAPYAVEFYNGVSACSADVVACALPQH